MKCSKDSNHETTLVPMQYGGDYWYCRECKDEIKVGLGSILPDGIKLETVKYEEGNIFGISYYKDPYGCYYWVSPIKPAPTLEEELQEAKYLYQYQKPAYKLIEQYLKWHEEQYEFSIHPRSYTYYLTDDNLQNYAFPYHVYEVVYES